jgi:hypothetical protein
MERRRESMPLVDWDALSQFVEATYLDFSRYGTDFLRFRARHEGAEAWFKLRPLHGTDPEWVYFMSKVCPEARIEPRAALYRSGVTPIGELSLFGEYLLIGQRVPLPGLTSRLVEVVVQELVRERALVLRELVKEPGGEGDPGPSAYAHLIE